MHELDNLVDHHRIGHVDAHVSENAHEGPHEPSFECRHNSQEDILCFLGLEYFLDLNDFVLDHVLVADSSEVLNCKLVLLCILNDLESPIEKQLVVPSGLAQQRLLFPDLLVLIDSSKDPGSFLSLVVTQIRADRLDIVVVVLFHLLVFLTLLLLLNYVLQINQRSLLGLLWTLLAG